MANPLMQIPGLAGYIAAKQQNEQQTMGNLQQASTVLGIQDAMQKRARAQEYESAVGALGPNPTAEALAPVVARYNPEKGLDIMHRTQDRTEAREQRATQFAETLSQRQQALEQRREEFMQRTQDAQARQAFEQQYRQQQQVLQQTQQAFNNEMKKLGLEITQQGNQLRLQKFDVDQRAAEDRQVEQQIGKTADRLKDVQPVITAANQLNDILGNYTPDTVPGLGYAKNTDVGKAFLSDEGKNVSSSVKLLGNSILKAMSGTAVTAPEEVRQMAAQMADGRFSAKDFYIAWPKLAQWVNEQTALGTAGLTDKSRPKFIERTKLPLDPIKPRFSFDGKELKDTRAPAASPVDALLEKYK